MASFLQINEKTPFLKICVPFNSRVGFCVSYITIIVYVFPFLLQQLQNSPILHLQELT